MELLRIMTAGSVDDGKSTLIGRLLFDSKALLKDQLNTLERLSKKKGLAHLDFSLVTDGLKDEMAQGITIDVAHRYFNTGTRKYILTDTPGHVEYTRNYVTAASSAQVAILLIDARNGATQQTRRHMLVASVMGITHIIFCVNKMDLVNYAKEVYEQINDDIAAFASRLNFEDIRYIPMSALHGENVVASSENMPWYKGGSLLDTLNGMQPPANGNAGFRLPVQTVIRVDDGLHRDHRAFAGRVASGIARPGDDVVILPEGYRSRIKEIWFAGGTIAEASAGKSVAVTLEDDIDAGRGSMIAAVAQPSVSAELEVFTCILANIDLSAGTRWILRTQVSEVKALVTAVVHKIDIDNFANMECTSLAINDMGRIRLRLAGPLVTDSFMQGKATGAAVLIDERTNNTVAALMVLQ